MAGPLNLARITLQFEGVLPRLAILEPLDCAVTLDVHQSGSGLDFIA